MSLYAFGSNGSGQLGVGHIDDINEPERCRISGSHRDHEFLWPHRIKAVKGGGNHTLVLLDSGSLYTSGDVSDGRTDLEVSEDSISSFKRLPSSLFGDSKVKFCSALWETTIVVNEHDQVYTFGNGSKGERGAGEQTQESSGPLDRFFPVEEHIVDLASSMAHTIVVLSNGDAYGWGNGRKGQLGEPAEIVWKPRKIQGLPFKVARAVCGREFSFLVGDPKEGRHAVLGSDKWNVRSAAPALIPDWQDIAASWGSIFVLDKSGRLHAWGRNDHGQLQVAEYPDPIARIAAGSEHVIVLSKDGAIAVSGWGEHGNCGSRTDTKGDAKEWSQIQPPYSHQKPLQVVGIAAGCATSFLWSDTDASSKSNSLG
ncbi:MAG: hypothetical protein Q9174_004839 [Haloplaca sp. 1 TL-2023]